MMLVLLLQYAALGLAQEISDVNNFQQNEYGQTNYGQNYGPNNERLNNNNYDSNFNNQNTFGGSNVNYNNFNNQYDYNTNTFIGSSGYFEDLRCPEHWYQFQESCYRFIKSPLKNYYDARTICQTYSPDNGGSDLVSIGSPEEHGFLVHHLDAVDPQHRRWYVGARLQSGNRYINVDGRDFIHADGVILPEPEPYGKDYLAYNFTRRDMHWAFQPVRGDEPLLFICEAHIKAVQRLVIDERSYTYGVDVDNPERTPRGPYFVKQPQDAIFDGSKRNLVNYVSLSCLAGGYPTPTYEWFREAYERDRLVARPIDPLSSDRYTISGGILIIDRPEQKLDHATYHCKASNKFGTIISQSVSITFGFILEFNLKRSPEVGDQNWGKSIYCDPPTHYPSVRYHWSRDYFSNFVEEDRRVFASDDGALYFSALETIDRANYSCSVLSDFSDSGRYGPFFPLRVNPHSNYQQLKFPNTFPKAFPGAPIAGKDVKLECVAFGYPVPHYNWTRIDGVMPRNITFSSFNRILTIHNVKVEDEGEYSCRAYNDRSDIVNSVILKIQAEPNFTIPLADRHVDRDGQLVWTCEAFGIPDVNYTWWKNGRQLVMGYLDQGDRGRIRIQDNVLTIDRVNEERDDGMYQCRAANTLKTVYSTAQLRVLAFRPSFKKTPLEAETYAAEQGNVTLACRPEAAPRPRYQWMKDGNQIGPGGHRRIYENGDLVIGPVSRDDEGVYACRATNEMGMDESKGRLIVLRGPRLVDQLPPQIVTEAGANVDLRCYATTDEMLDIAYIWTHNGMTIRDIDVYNSYNRLKIEGGYMRILNATFSDSGEYRCIVKSAVGQISSSCMVTIEGPPGPPGGVEALGMRKDSVTLRWTDGAAHGAPIHSYLVSGRTNWNATWVDLSAETGGVVAAVVDRNTNRKEALLEARLTPWSVYEFRVAAVNRLGVGPASAPTPKVSTVSDRPYVAPSAIGGGGGKIGDLTITWEPLRAEQQNGLGIHYKVFWKRKDHETEFESKVLRDHGNVGKAVVHIESKFYYTPYVVKVQALNDLGAGPISPETVIFSAEDMPQAAPQRLSALSYNSTALNVSWAAVSQLREHIRGKLIGHRVKYWPRDGDEADSVYYLSRTTRPWSLIVGLQPDTVYNVKVMAYNAAGEGPESERFQERTYRKAPQKPPSSVHIKAIDPTSIKVVWRYVQPQAQEEPLQGFKIRVWEMDQDLSTANDTIIPFGVKLEGYVYDLSPGKTYKLRVLAFSNGGDGRMSSPELNFQMGDPRYYRSSSDGLSSSISLILSIALCLSIYNNNIV